MLPFKIYQRDNSLDKFPFYFQSCLPFYPTITQGYKFKRAQKYLSYKMSSVFEKRGKKSISLPINKTDLQFNPSLPKIFAKYAKLPSKIQ